VLEAGADRVELPLPARQEAAAAGAGEVAARPDTAAPRRADLVLTGEPAVPRGPGERAALPEPDAEPR
jgi:hypothetical protein